MTGIITHINAGFANKLYCWQCAWALAKINNMQVFHKWDGDHMYLHLPNTSHLSTRKNKKVNLNTTNLKSPYIIDNTNDNELVCGWNFNREIYPSLNYNVMNEVEFNHPLNEKIKNLCYDKNIVGVHIRRGDFNKPKNLDSDFTECNCQIHDRWYIKKMEEIKEENPNVIFYISSNGTKEELKKYYDRFNVIDKKVFDMDLKRPSCHIKLWLPDLVDFFVLCNAQTLLRPPNSTYSSIASEKNENRRIISGFSYENEQGQEV